MRPLEGYRVVELSTTVAGPAAGAMLCDFGADVVKVEPPAGDPFRNALGALGGRGSKNEYLASPPFYSINRGKRSVVLDLKQKDGKDALEQLLGTADVFLTNFRQRPLAEMGFGAEQVAARHPRLVVCALTGFGRSGPSKDDAGYDIGVFYGRSGLAQAFTASHPKFGDGAEAMAPVMPGAVGDVTTATAAAGGICAALLARERTGKGQIVDASLLRSGLWTNMWSLSTTLAFGKTGGARSRAAAYNPLINHYRTADGHQIVLLGFEADRHYPSIARALGTSDEWANDPRFRSASQRTKHSRVVCASIDAAVGKHDLAHWKRRFEEEGVWWQPANTQDGVIRDEQVAAAGGLSSVAPSAADDAAGVKSIRVVSSPIDFSGSRRVHPLPPTPPLGAHTREVLAEVGVPEAVIRRCTSKL